MRDVLPEDARRRLRHAYDAIPDVTSRPMILFGCGPLGRRTSAALASSQMPPLAFADNDATQWGAAINNILILSPQAAIEAHGDTAIFVVTIYNGEAARNQLRAMGCRFLLHFAELYHALPDMFMPWLALADPTETLNADHEICAARRLWADEASRSEFDAQLGWRIGLPAPLLLRHDPPSECYFPNDIFAASAEGAIVDCGAFDGDTLRQLLERDRLFSGYVGLEPDPENFRRLRGFVATLPEIIRQQVHIQHCAVAARSGILRFDACGNVGSGIAADGNIEVEAATLDEILADHQVAMIKMDVEGGELDALQGGRMTLARDGPMLAISAYHHPADLWNIPLLINAIMPAYDLYLRRYAEDCWELICYAICRTAPGQV